jgi:hypothetical protein
MNKLSLNALKERAEVIASAELLSTINGGLENSCHVVTDSEGNTTIYGPVSGTIIIH